MAPVPAGFDDGPQGEAWMQLAKGIQEDMMVALLESVQSSAAACAHVCIQRLKVLHQEIGCTVQEGGAQLDGGASNFQVHAEDVHQRSTTSPRKGHKRYSLCENDADNEQCHDENYHGQEKGASIEDLYLSSNWETLHNAASLDAGVFTPPPMGPMMKRLPRRHSEFGDFRIAIDRRYWSQATSKSLFLQLQALSQKHANLKIATFISKGEIFARGDSSSIEAAKPELGSIVLEHFPLVALPESLRVWAGGQAAFGGEPSLEQVAQGATAEEPPAAHHAELHACYEAYDDAMRSRSASALISPRTFTNRRDSTPNSPRGGRLMPKCRRPMSAAWRPPGSGKPT
jgi:hypothetical protein